MGDICNLNLRCHLDVYSRGSFYQHEAVLFSPYDISFEYDSHMFRELVSCYFLASSEKGFYNLGICIALNLTPDR